MLMVNLRCLIVAICLVGLVAPAWSVAVDTPLADPSLEARARAIHKQLRCLVCQNQSIEDSNSSLARDLRILVRDRVTAGDSDAAAIDFVVDRYGDWVLLRPPMKWGTAILWLGPALFLILALTLIVFWYRRRQGPDAAIGAPLNANEKAQLRALLDDGDHT
jgi:cytochrome c-type biogenesis protein CcmH